MAPMMSAGSPTFATMRSSAGAVPRIEPADPPSSMPARNRSAIDGELRHQRISRSPRLRRRLVSRFTPALRLNVGRGRIRTLRFVRAADHVGADLLDILGRELRAEADHAALREHAVAHQAV